MSNEDKAGAGGQGAAPFRLDGKTAFVTGAASGIGAEIARVLAAQGARVLVADRSENAGRAVAEEIGGQFVLVDVASEESVSGAFAAALGERAPDILVNSAGIGFVGNILNTALDDYERLFAVNARGVFLCCREGVRRMNATGKGGSIVNIASIASKAALQDRFAYAATKGAVLMMTKALACDHVGDGIRCNCICPARVHTALVDTYLAKNYPGKEAEMLAKLSAAQPMGRMGTPREVANLALYLCSDEAAFVTGAAYDIDGGTLAMR